MDKLMDELDELLGRHCVEFEGPLQPEYSDRYKVLVTSKKGVEILVGGQTREEALQLAVDKVKELLEKYCKTNTNREGGEVG